MRFVEDSIYASEESYSRAIPDTPSLDDVEEGITAKELAEQSQMMTWRRLTDTSVHGVTKLVSQHTECDEEEAGKKASANVRKKMPQLSKKAKLIRTKRVN